MARTITFNVSTSSISDAITGGGLSATTYTFTTEKDFNFLIDTLTKFKNDTYDSPTFDLTIYTTNTVLTDQIALRFGDLD